MEHVLGSGGMGRWVVAGVAGLGGAGAGRWWEGCNPGIPCKLSAQNARSVTRSANTAARIRQCRKPRPAFRSAFACPPARQQKYEMEESEGTSDYERNVLSSVVRSEFFAFTRTGF